MHFLKYMQLAYTITWIHFLYKENVEERKAHQKNEILEKINYNILLQCLFQAYWYLINLLSVKNYVTETWVSVLVNFGQVHQVF